MKENEDEEVGGWLLVVSVAMAAGMAGAAGAAGLPSNYVEVGYVESTKGAYIDTGVKASKALRAEMDFSPLEYTGDVSLGMQTLSDIDDWRFFNYKDGFIFDCGNVRVGWNNGGGSVLALTNRYSVAVGCTNNVVYAAVTGKDGKTKAYYQQFSGPVSSRDVKACASAMRLYSLKIYEDDTPKRDFVPCIRQSDGVAGLYDLVDGKFYDNAGSGVVGCGFEGGREECEREECLLRDGGG